MCEDEWLSPVSCCMIRSSSRETELKNQEGEQDETGC